jgi:hypothetical protein
MHSQDLLIKLFSEEAALLTPLLEEVQAELLAPLHFATAVRRHAKAICRHVS